MCIRDRSCIWTVLELAEDVEKVCYCLDVYCLTGHEAFADLLKKRLITIAHVPQCMKYSDFLCVCDTIIFSNRLFEVPHQGFEPVRLENFLPSFLQAGVF